MAREKNFTYTITYKDKENGKIITENACVNRARGYGQSWFATEEAARKRVKNNLDWINNSQRFEVVEWTLSDRNGIIEHGSEQKEEEPKAEEKEMEKVITKEDAMKAVDEWNAKIDGFMKNELPKLLEAEGYPVKNGKVSMNAWFKANEIIGKQNFYTEGHAIQMKLRDAGHDIKMNMQDHTLVYPRYW